MFPNESPKSEVISTEAAASWNTRYLSPDGFECQLTLRGESGQEVLEKALGAITHLLSSGCTPIAYSWKGMHSQANNDSHENGGGDNNNNGNDRSWCPIHECTMRKWEKDGRVWYSHKAGDQWCTGKTKNK
jgi:hypothetical protein